MFRIIVPLDDEYSFDYSLGNTGTEKKLVNADEVSGDADKMVEGADKTPITADKSLTASQMELISNFTKQQNKIYQYVLQYKSITTRQTEMLLGLKQRRAREILREMVDMGALEKFGAYKSTVYRIREEVSYGKTGK